MGNHQCPVTSAITNARKRAGSSVLRTSTGVAGVRFLIYMSDVISKNLFLLEERYSKGSLEFSYGSYLMALQNAYPLLKKQIQSAESVLQNAFVALLYKSISEAIPMGQASCHVS
jgi:hypothetical protein